MTGLTSGYSNNYFDELANNFTKLPAIGSKTAVRLAAFIVKSDKEIAEKLAESILNAKKHIKTCKICGNYSETDFCGYCLSDKRLKNIICIVEEPLDILTIEKTGGFKGVYHVLNGALSIQRGIGPSGLNIQSLLSRLQNKDSHITEIIIATNPTLDGDSTALYLKKKIEELGINVKITRLAMGLPSGSNIEYSDRETLSRALINRTEL